MCSIGTLNSEGTVTHFSTKDAIEVSEDEVKKNRSPTLKLQCFPDAEIVDSTVNQ